MSASGPVSASESWLDIWLDSEGPSRARRTPLKESLTRIGGADAEVQLPAVGADQLHVWNSPARVLFFGRGPKPACAGVAFEERELTPGERLQWAGYTLLFAREDTRAGAALPAPPPTPKAMPAPARSVSARRKPREASLGLGAFLMMQVASFLLFALLVAAILVVLHIKGISLDAWLDRLVPG